MRVYANQLPNHLSKGLKPVYLVFGDEPLQKVEAIQAIRDSAKAQGFDERLSLTAAPQFDWYSLFDAFNSLSLFSSRKLIELEVDKGKVGQTGAKVLNELLGLFNPDTILVLHGGKLDAATTKAKWFKNLDAQGLYVPIYPIEGDNFGRWLAQRAQQSQLMIEPQGLTLLAEFYAGNLLAAAQELDKLAISFRGQAITSDYLQRILLNQSRFSVFQLVDELLLGNIDNALKVLISLQREGLEPNIVNWALSREVLQLLEMKEQLDAQVPLNQILNEKKVWKNRQAMVTSALNRLSVEQFETLVDALQTIDIKLKSNSHFNPYSDFCHVVMLFGFAAQLKGYRLSA